MDSPPQVLVFSFMKWGADALKVIVSYGEIL